jgi:hypothetical protein
VLACARAAAADRPPQELASPDARAIVEPANSEPMRADARLNDVLLVDRQHGWARSILVHQIELDLYGREGRAITNFPLTLPAPQSELAQQTLKDPYVFDFLTLADEAGGRAK